MAQIVATDNTKIYQIKNWLGLNESPDGDTGLALGEAAVMRNFRITRENHLQLRPGYAPVCTLAEGLPVRGLWEGYVKGTYRVLCACGGKLWEIDREEGTAAELGEIEDAAVSFFGFAEKVYLLTGTEYYVWDGEDPPAPVEGYVPIVTTATPPEGGGTLVERVNLLTGKKRGVYSPDGSAKTFQLPETEIDEVLSVEGTDIGWTADAAAGTVTFESVPPKGVSTITITWKKGEGSREKIAKMRFAELYNGEADTRIFLYGDGSSLCLYSDLDENGKPSAEYFPDMNEMAVDSANTPIMGMIRHFDNLLIFKEDGTFCAQYSTTTLDTGAVTAAFYCVPINREIGSQALGQVRLVQNDPYTLFGQGVYQWKVSAYSTRTERNVKRISDRVEATLERFPTAECRMYDDEGRQELYVCWGDEALIHNYGNNTWYYYDHFPARELIVAEGEVWFGTEDGRIMHLSRQYRNDDGEAIDACWESGSMDFEQDWKRKYSANIWVAVKPESQSRITVTARSNRKSDYAEKVVAYGMFTLTNVNFNHWSFGVNRNPQVQRVRLKVKKFTFYKLIFQSKSASAAATVLGVDFQVRYTGNVK